MNLSELAATLLCCPDCRVELTVRDNALACESCARVFDAEGGILRMLPTRSLPEPALYSEPNYKKYNELLPQIHAEHYNPGTLTSWMENLLKRQMEARFEPRPRTILDIGCGAGTSFSMFETADLLIGLDNSLELLQQARADYPGAVLIQADVAFPPLKDGAVPCMFASAVLEHLFYLEHCLSGLERSLHPDGYLVVAVPTEGALAMTMARKWLTAPKYSKTFGFDYLKAMEGEHCNSVYAIESALKKHFRLESRTVMPLYIGGYHMNFSAVFKLRKRA